MEFKHNKANVSLAKTLRKNMTPEEKHLWYDFLKDYPIRFMRQKTLGNYIVDFYCAKAKLVLEIDGIQHYFDEEYEKDTRRTEYLEKNFGVTIVRFTNLDITNKFEGVCNRIDELVEQSLRQQC
ncbi:MAG: endonuclease domain-containing protein [Ruminococcaceae bacterium]|nr:endonuclease domain-containing protein [Oscillospiraceae bacterium]